MRRTDLALPFHGYKALQTAAFGEDAGAKFTHQSPRAL